MMTSLKSASEEEVKRILIRNSKHGILSNINKKGEVELTQIDILDPNNLVHIGTKYNKVLVWLYLLNQKQYTTNERKYLDSILDQPFFAEKYKEIREDFESDAEVCIREQETAAPTPATNTTPITREDRRKLYSGADTQLFCGSVEQNKMLKIDKAFNQSEYYDELVDFIEFLAQNGYVEDDNLTKNSYFVHFTGYGGNCAITKQLRWKEDVKSLVPALCLIFPENARYALIEKVFSIDKMITTYKNGTDYDRIRTRGDSNFISLVYKYFKNFGLKPQGLEKL